jgi:hypothetical protein
LAAVEHHITLVWHILVLLEATGQD